MASPREHVEQIRKTKFYIGGELNPLTEDLHQAVKHLSDELYAKDVHFLMELIQVSPVEQCKANVAKTMVMQGKWHSVYHPPLSWQSSTSHDIAHIYRVMKIQAYNSFLIK